MNWKETLKKALMVKRSSLANHKTPPAIDLLINKSPELKHLSSKKGASYANCKFFVLSDLHHYSSALGMSGAEWEAEIGHDRKLFNHSKEILEKLVQNINKEKADFVLISGDLSKDGELLSHKEVTEILAKIKSDIYVVPGNHDIYNPDAASFNGIRKKIESVDREGFAHLYSNFGYQKAFSRHKDSLSYTALLKDNLMLVALDTLWVDETDKSDKMPKELLVDGRLSKSLWQWLEEQLIWAKTFNKAVIALQHHPFIEHWEGELEFMPEYLVENHLKLAQLYANYGVRICFVGHFHAQNITTYNQGPRKVYQVLTSSPITYPCAYRYLQLKNNYLGCKSSYIDSIPSIPSSTEFNKIALNKLHEAVRQAIEKPLKLMGVNEEDREKIIFSGSNAYQLNYEGANDDSIKMADSLLAEKEKLGLMGRIALSSMGYVIEGMAESKSDIDDNDFWVDLGR